MNRIIILYIVILLSLGQAGSAQVKISGRVMSADGQIPLRGATVKLKGGTISVLTDTAGRFNIPLQGERRVLQVSYIGYKLQEVAVGQDITGQLLIRLEREVNVLSEVLVSTGYQDVPQERATGSFARVSNAELNMRAGPDIVSRLEGMSSGLNFNRRLASLPDNRPSLSIRGLSTFYAETDPLIVVDNFPYEGDINSINPNDVESVTILKDAAAASIWGARAGNGVIVITTKKGGFNQPFKIQVNSVYTLAAKPDLHYNPEFLNAADYISVERQLFARGFYAADETNSAKPVISPVVELLIARRDGKISSAEADAQISLLQSVDVRREMEKYLYRTGANRQTALNISGGTQNIHYYLSGGYDNNDHQIKGNGYSRFSLNSQNMFRPGRNVEITAGINYIESTTGISGIGVREISPASGKGIYPYARLADDHGEPVVMLKNYRSSYAASAESSGLLNWQYKPLDEAQLGENSRHDTDIRINGGLKYRFLKLFSAEARYQYQQADYNSRVHMDHRSFFVRDLLNRFTQPNGSNPIPYGGILNLTDEKVTAHSGRGQLNFNHDWKTSRISAIAGAEIRETDNFSHSTRFYGYDEEVLNSQLMIDYVTRFPTLPRSTASIPTGVTPLSNQLDRFVSYYFNSSYELLKRYMLSASLRQDASNLFGVATNQKRVPLWSAGLGWEVSAEPFYKATWLPYLKFRATYGYNGNTDKSVTAFATARYSSDPLTGLPIATVLSPGNPELRWERVGIANLGIDFASPQKRISGSLEVYRKYGEDLLGNLPLDPTTGYLESYRINYAALQTSGIDLQLRSTIAKGRFTWDNDILFSYVRDKVTRFDHSGVSVSSYFNGFSLPTVGKSLYRLYSYPEAALDPATGDPMVMLNGAPSKDYSTYTRTITAGQLIDHGQQLPPFFGSIRNTFGFKEISLSMNLTWKAGYYFRRSSIQYDQLFNNWRGHRDFALRWQKPGDELLTYVPSMPLLPTANRDAIYYFSPRLIEKGDHIRVQDINITYTPSWKFMGSYANKLRFYFYASNLGILWRANKQGLDPDYPSVEYLQPKTYSFGINANL